jgi:hypothetical protein
MAESTSLFPFSAPSEPDEYEHTTAGRKLCPCCGEYVYPRRKTGSSGGFAFGPFCEVCGAELPGDE